MAVPAKKKTVLKATRKPAPWHPSVEIEEVYDDESDHHTSVPPRNPRCILESADGSDDDIEGPKLIVVDNNKDESGNNGGDNGRGDDSDNSDDELLTTLDQEMEELLKLAGNIDLEEQITVGAGNETDTTEDDNDEGWVDED